MIGMKIAAKKKWGSAVKGLNVMHSNRNIIIYDNRSY
jgi:hypothetical protein